MAVVPSNNFQNMHADTGFRAAFKIKLNLIIINGTVMVQSTYLSTLGYSCTCTKHSRMHM